MNKIFLVVFTLAMSSGSAFAVPPTTIAELTASINFADVSLGILAVAALLTTVYVGWRAAKFVIVSVGNGKDPNHDEIRRLARENRERAERFNSTGHY